MRLQKELEVIRNQVREIQKKRESQQTAEVAKAKLGMPIIIVPAASTSVITYVFCHCLVHWCWLAKLGSAIGCTM